MRAVSAGTAPSNRSPSAGGPAAPAPQPDAAAPPPVEPFALDLEQARTQPLDQLPGASGWWLHVDALAPATPGLLAAHGLDEVVIGALTAEDTRPRVDVDGPEVLLMLRGANLNPGASPEDMVSLRLWTDGRRLVTAAVRPLQSVRDLWQSILGGHGPEGMSALVARLVLRLTARLRPVVTGMETLADGYEEASLEPMGAAERARLADLHRAAIRIRRFLGPQADALYELRDEPPPWLDETCLDHLREAEDGTRRMVESLDAIKEHAALLQHRAQAMLAERSQKTIYVLTVVTAIFLPLHLVAGLMGANVGGVPWADNSHGFVLLVLVTGAITGLQILILRWLRWI